MNAEAVGINMCELTSLGTFLQTVVGTVVGTSVQTCFGTVLHSLSWTWTNNFYIIFMREEKLSDVISRGNDLTFVLIENTLNIL